MLTKWNKIYLWSIHILVVWAVWQEGLLPNVSYRMFFTLFFACNLKWIYEKAEKVDEYKESSDRLIETLLDDRERDTLLDKYERLNK